MLIRTQASWYKSLPNNLSLPNVWDTGDSKISEIGRKAVEVLSEQSGLREQAIVTATQAAALLEFR